MAQPIKISHFRPSDSASLAAGYAHPLYTGSLREFGEPISLPMSGGYALRRPIEQSRWLDAMGSYPIFSCANWEALPGELAQLASKLVSISLVADPFGNYTFNDLVKAFDRVVPFKRHFVIDVEGEPTVTKHHRYYARRALKDITIEACSNLCAYAEEWTGLYANLIARHELRGIKAFSRAVFDVQLQVPGVLLLRAIHEGRTVGAHIWYTQGNVAYSHLMALSDEGYELNGSYALYSETISRAAEFFGPSVRYLNLGAGAGLDPNADDGLTRFKRGWTDATRPVFFCGRILDQAKYDALCAARGIGATKYFPAYREGEFA